MLRSSLCGFPFDHKSRSCMQEGSKTILLHYTFQRWISRPPSSNQTLRGYSFVKMNSFGNKMCVSLKRSHPILAVPATLLNSTDVSNNGGYLSRYVQSTRYLVLAKLRPWSCPSSRLLYNDRFFYNLSRVLNCHQQRWHTSRSTYYKSTTYTRLNQGLIEPPKAVRGHATPYTAYIDGIVLNVTKYRIYSGSIASLESRKITCLWSHTCTKHLPRVPAFLAAKLLL